jgi:hypothetical protein
MLRRLLILALACLVPGLVSSPPRAYGDTPRPLVVDLTTLTRTPRASAIGPFIASKTPFQPGTYPLISGSAPEFVDTFRWAYPAAADRSCPPDQPELDARLTQARGQIVELDLDKALESLQAAYQGLPCQTTPIHRDALRRLFYLEGIARHYQGDEEGSARAFLEALAVDSSLEPIPGFPPEISDAYLQAAKQLPSITAVRVPIDQGLRQAGVQIDGVELPASEQVSLLPGRHVAQVMNAEQVARTAIFTVEPNDSRPMTTMIEVMPPGSASYLNAVLRTALQGASLNPAQITALNLFARQRNHPLLMFVVVGETGGLKLLTFEPGRGLREGAPPGLKPLPAMDGAAAPVAESRGKKPKKPKLEADEEVEPERPKQPHTPSRRSRQRDVLDDLPSDEPVDLPTMAVRLELGELSYSGRMFTSLRPTFAYRVWEGLYAQASLYFANDLGLSDPERGALSLYGGRLGAEYALPVGPVSARCGLGLSLTAAGVREGVLVLEGTPELWLGADYPLMEQLTLGAYVGGGYTPGLINAEGGHGLWRTGLSVAWLFP